MGYQSPQAGSPIFFRGSRTLDRVLVKIIHQCFDGVSRRTPIFDIIGAAAFMSPEPQSARSGAYDLGSDFGINDVAVLVL